MAGGLDTCEYLVHEDAMTPLLSLLHKVSSRLKSKLVEQNAMQLASVIAGEVVPHHLLRYIPLINCVYKLQCIYNII